MGEPLILSERDAARLERMLREWESRTDIRYQRRRRHGGSGGGTRPHKAYAKAAAGTGSTIVCHLDTDETGEEITVQCELIGTSDLNAVTPRFKDGTMIVVWNDNGTWRPYFPFQKAVDC